MSSRLCHANWSELLMVSQYVPAVRVTGVGSVKRLSVAPQPHAFGSLATGAMVKLVPGSTTPGTPALSARMANVRVDAQSQPEITTCVRVHVWPGGTTKSSAMRAPSVPVPPFLDEY